MIFKAIEFAAKAHSGQFRKGTNIPYIFHLMNVMKTLCDANVSENLIVAGILHDVLEDTKSTKEDILIHFGEEVLDLVVGESEPNKSLPWKVRKQYSIRFFEQDATEEQLIIACADKCDNASSILEDYIKHGDFLWERFNAGKDDQIWYYSSISSVIQKRATDFGEPLLSLANNLKFYVDTLIKESK